MFKLCFETDAEKPFTLSQFIEKLQHFEISFDKKKQNSDFWQF
jgi:hypothetical protein